MIPDIIERVWFYSQTEGMYDREIAEILGCHRVTVTRTRVSHNIPRPNFNNRRDKEQVCKRCSQVTLIRRCERKLKHCPHCRQTIREERLQKKRQRWQDNKKKHSAGMLPSYQNEVQ